jgi:hypothetical protein
MDLDLRLSACGIFDVDRKLLSGVKPKYYMLSFTNASSYRDISS